MNYKVGMISLGCAKNQVDAEMLLYTLKERGFQFVSDPEEADAVIVNTCGFIESAKQESIDEILELGNLKREGKIKAIVVTGCLAERYQDEITKQLYEIDAAVGIGANDKIADVVLKALAGDKVELFPDKLELPLSGLIRGRFRSRTMENVLEEARELAAKGVKELNVIAQDTTRYGEDLYGTPQLAKLLKELCKIDGFRWIRVLYCYPDRVTDELIDVMASEDKIVKYIDLPLQHCNGEILRRMNRRGNRDTLTTLLQKIKEKMPDVVLRSTFITGFPGETEEQFEELAEFANDIRFQRLGCFAYSQEEDTSAALMPDQIDEEIKQERADIIMDNQQTIMAEYCESLLGTDIEVLCEGFDRIAECFYGRSYADAPEVDGCVFFTCGEKKPKAGDFVRVHIDDYLGCDPVGVMIDE